MQTAETRIRIPKLRAAIGILAALVLLCLGAFLRRYRGADQTAMFLAMLVSAGLCLVFGLAWFRGRFEGAAMTGRKLRLLGLRYGAVTGLCTPALGIGLLAVRWALDLQATPTGDRFVPAFFMAMSVLGKEMAAGTPAFVAISGVLGSLLGLAVAEIIIALARLEPQDLTHGPPPGD